MKVVSIDALKVCGFSSRHRAGLQPSSSVFTIHGALPHAGIERAVGAFSSFHIRYVETLLVGACGAFAWFYLLEEPDDDDAAEAEQGEPAEDVDEGPVEGLALELLVEHGLGRVGGVGFAEESGERVGSGG